MTTRPAIPVPFVLVLTLSALAGGCVTKSAPLGVVDDDGAADGTDEGVEDGADGASATSMGGVDDGPDDDSGTDGGSPACELAVGSSDGRALDEVRWHNTIGDLLGVDLSIEITGWFGSDLFPVVVPSPELEAVYADGAVAASAAVDIAALLTCDASVIGGEADACITQLASDLGRLAYRRPLEAAEVDALVALQPGTTADVRGRAVVEALLSSESFWTVDESGTEDPQDPGTIVLGQYAIASRLAYFVWASTPDDVLLDRAAAGELSDPSVRAQEVARMLADPRGVRALGDYWEAVLDTNELETLERDAELFPAWDASLGLAMREEVRRLAADVVLTEGTWDAMLSVSRSFVNDPLAAAVYAGDIVGGAPASGDHVLVQLDPARRPGLLTRAAPMTRWSEPGAIMISQRGLLVTDRLLCISVPPPPAEVDTSPPDTEGLTRRDFIEGAHTADPTCTGCHSLFDPVTPGFDNYDPIGRWQTELTALGAPASTGDPVFAVDSSGEIPVLDSSVGVFASRDELLELLSTSPEVHECVVRGHLGFALGRHLAEEDECTVETLTTAFEDNGGDIRQLIDDVVASDAFVRTRS